MRILRHEVPADGKVHPFQLSGAIVHAAARDVETVVEFWAIETGRPPRERLLTVVGTGREFSPPVIYLDTAITASGEHVWHLLEVVR